MLIRVRLSDLRTRAARFFGRVAAGETIAIEYRGRTVAALQPRKVRSRAAMSAVSTTGPLLSGRYLGGFRTPFRRYHQAGSAHP